METWKDTIQLLKKGKSPIINILLNSKDIFNNSEGRNLFNQLYVDQYICWSQKLKDSQLFKIAEELDEILKNLDKSQLDLELKELENAAEIVQKEEKEEELSSKMAKVNFDDSDDDSSDDSDDDSNDDSDSDEWKKN